MQNNRENLDKALDLFEPGFKIERKQGIQEHRELIKAFTEPKPNLCTDMSNKASAKR